MSLSFAFLYQKQLCLAAIQWRTIGIGVLMRILLVALRSTSIIRRVGVDESGAALVEFALVAPLLILLMGGTVILTWAFINYATLSYAAGTGAQVITTERLNITSTNWTPYADTVSAVKNASSILDPTALGIVI